PLPEQLVQRFAQHLADAAAELDRGVVLLLFNGVDGLAGYPHRLRQRALGHVFFSPGGFHFQVFCHRYRLTTAGWWLPPPRPSKARIPVALCSYGSRSLSIFPSQCFSPTYCRQPFAVPTA